MSASTLSPLAALLAGHTAAPAIGAPARAPASYATVIAQIEQIADDLGRIGIGADDRVAIVLPNGPAMAACFLAVAAATGAAPLNPSYRVAEFEFYLDDLAPKAMILPAGEASSAREVAARAGLPIIELLEDASQPAGIFQLDYRAQAAATVQRRPGAADIALLLHTSGTTSRPKLVPLSQANLCASARHIAHTLR